MKDKPRSGFEKADHIVTEILRWISYLGALALIVIAVISTVDVIATKIFRHPISNVTEFVTYMNIPVVFFCLGFVQVNQGHTHIDLLYKHASPLVQKIVHIIGYIIGLGVCGFAGWRGIVLMVQKLDSMTYASGPTSFLVWPFVACIGLGYLVLAFGFLWCIPKELLGKSPYVFDEGGGAPAAEDKEEVSGQ